MQGIFLKILVAMGTKLLTEKFLGKLVCYSLWKISQSTENKLDDKMVAAVAEALSVIDYK